jgi:hypothetical protein
MYIYSFHFICLFFIFFLSLFLKRKKEKARQARQQAQPTGPQLTRALCPLFEWAGPKARSRARISSRSGTRSDPTPLSLSARRPHLTNPASAVLAFPLEPIPFRSAADRLSPRNSARSVAPSPTPTPYKSTSTPPLFPPPSSLPNAPTPLESLAVAPCYHRHHELPPLATPLPDPRRCHQSALHAPLHRLRPSQTSKTHRIHRPHQI